MRHRLSIATALLSAALFPALAQTPPPSPAPPAKPADPTHAWIGLHTPADLDNWVQWHIAEERRLIATVLAVHGARTEANTLEPLDQAELHLTLASQETYTMFGVHPSKEIRDKAQSLVQVITKEQTDLSLNQPVYNALKAVNTAHSDAATKYLVTRSLLEYHLAGVDQDQAARDKIRQLSDQQTALTLQFNRNIQDDVRKVILTDKAELDGLPPDYIARHKPDPQGNITLTTDAPDYGPVMTYASSAKLRRDMFLAYNNRAYPANQQVLRDLLQSREDLAHILGYKTWAVLATADMMVGSAANMKAFLAQVDDASRPLALHEFQLLADFAKAQEPGARPLTLSDSGFWGERYRRANYDFDSQSVRPYFPYTAVEAGILKTASQLFHIEFRANSTQPVWDPSVHVYDVFDAGKLAGRIYLDMHPREGKDKWFAEWPLVPGVRDQELPEAALVCNFPGGVAGDPGLLQFGEVVTFFHEFGHMMHEVLGGHQRWASQTGISTERDFIEAPSQMLEEMFHDPAILQSFARNYQTGEVLPTALIDRMNRASYYGRAGWVQGQLLFSNFALQLHDRPVAEVNPDALLAQDYARYSPFQFLPEDHMYTAFTHLAGYSSNYYTYVLDKVIAVDLFAAFDPKNPLNGPTAMRYRHTILEPGGSKPAADLVHDFLGRPQNLDALKRWMDREFETAPPTPARNGN